MDNELKKEDLVFCKGGGCTAKLGPELLGKVLSRIPKVRDEHLLVGYDSSDDAAVYRLTDDLAIVQTLDFFPPMVEDPYLFGQIAAANALSDIYAMGGEVKTALNIVCFPQEADLNILGQILLGGSEKVHEAGGVLAGGHSINDREVKYGLSVTGVIHPDKILPNNGCMEGDLLLLTKPLGVGLVNAAARLGAASKAALDQAVLSMTTLNKYAADCLKAYPVHGCTDVTGFGFLVHLCEMLGERFSARVFPESIPYIEESLEYADEFYLTAAGQRNRNYAAEKVDFAGGDFALEELLYDPQTSGGLLVSIGETDGLNALAEIKKLGLPCGVVGQVIKKQEKSVIVG